MKKYKFLFALFFMPILSFSQVEEPMEEEILEDTIIKPDVEIYEFEEMEMTELVTEKPKKWAFNGYIKDLRMAIIDTSNHIFLFNNQIHNRLNFSYFFNKNWTFKADLRTQIFYGTLLNTGNPLQPFSKGIDGANDDFFDLSLLISDNPTFTIHTILDRLYLDYTYEKLNVRVGRQRINWGINTVWNPHDIFNAFSYFDFDYEERPGSDALRVTYYTGATSSIEFAVKAFENIDEIVAGGLWKFNKWNYDFQILGGVFNKDIVTGLGWAGDIKGVGFKGETAIFQGYDTASTAVAATIALDYAFDNSMYASLGFLYNSLGTTESASANLLALNINAKNLFPYEYTGVAVVSYPFAPSFSGAISMIYSPSDDQLLFINPTLTYSIKDNWNIDLIGQIAGLKYNNGANYGFLTKLIFLRTKWSF
jgi:hypothetical protein